jgi:hypothetical protein
VRAGLVSVGTGCKFRGLFPPQKSTPILALAYLSVKNATPNSLRPATPKKLSNPRRFAMDSPPTIRSDDDLCYRIHKRALRGYTLVNPLTL